MEENWTLPSISVNALTSAYAKTVFLLNEFLDKMELIMITLLGNLLIEHCLGIKSVQN